MGEIRTTNLRLNLEKPIQRQAWEYLQTMDKAVFKSYSQAIVSNSAGKRKSRSKPNTLAAPEDPIPATLPQGILTTAPEPPAADFSGIGRNRSYRLVCRITVKIKCLLPVMCRQQAPFVA